MTDSGYNRVSIIIPVYNEQSTICEVIRRVSEVELPLEKEIIVVNDGSTDGTAEAMELSRGSITHTFVSPVNVGKGAAVRIGLSMVTGDVILIQDADLELDPGEYSGILRPIAEGRASVVYGLRFLGAATVPFSRKLANKFLTTLTNILFETRLTDMETAYKAFTREAASSVALHANRFEMSRS